MIKYSFYLQVYRQNLHRQGEFYRDNAKCVDCLEDKQYLSKIRRLANQDDHRGKFLLPRQRRGNALQLQNSALTTPSYAKAPQKCSENRGARRNNPKQAQQQDNDKRGGIEIRQSKVVLRRPPSLHFRLDCISQECQYLVLRGRKPRECNGVVILDVTTRFLVWIVGDGTILRNRASTNYIIFF